MGKKNNVIFFFTDQQRADTCGCFGQPLDITPNLDRIAADGVRFSNAFTPQPVCGPARAIFQSGLYATTTGCFRNGIMLAHSTKTIANYFEEAGYENAYIGKWHLASEEGVPNKPTIDYQTSAIPVAHRGGYNGFWRAVDLLEFTSHGYGGYVFDENNKRIDFEHYRADAMTDFALEFLDARPKDKPFFMTISYIEPHHQNDRNHYEGPNGSKERFKECVIPEDLKAFSHGDYLEEYPDYLGQCKSLDDNLGRLVEKLKEMGEYENTVIFFASDHGSHFRTRNRDKNLNGYDDYKRSCHDACLRVPLVVAGGAYKGGLEVKELVSTESLAKSMLAAAEIEVGDAMIGERLIDVASGKTKDRENVVFAQISESRVGRVIRTERYTYAVVALSLDGGSAAYSDRYSDDFLYDNFVDPNQLNNLINSKQHIDIKAKLRTRLLKHIETSEGRTAIISINEEELG